MEIRMESKLKLPQKPEDANPFYAEAFNKNDIDALLALFENEAKLINRNVEVIGKAAIKKVLMEYLQLNGKMKIRTKFSTQIENIALLSSEWEIEFKNQNGDVDFLKGIGSEIVRRQNDGTWLFIIDNPTSGNNLAFT